MVFRSFIEGRERAHHARDTNRRALPFEWGLEHLGLQRNGNPETALADYVDKALGDSDAFYAYQPTSEYAFDGHILKYPSYLQTPYPENNTVVARHLPGRGDLAMVVLPQWNCKWDGQMGLCRMLQQAGIGALRLSMPYHHQRKPAGIERSEYLVSPNLGRTIAAARQAVVDARRAADWLFDHGYRRVGLVGTSIGSCVAFLSFVHDQRFSAGVFIHVSSYYADVVWSGLSTAHVRKTLEECVDLERLRRYWEPISPFPYIRRLAGTARPILTLSGRYDLSFPAELSQQTYNEFQQRGVAAQTRWMPCGHYTMGKFPFSVVAGLRIRRFLLEHKLGFAG
jgi:hypothetical protein